MEIKVQTKETTDNFTFFTSVEDFVNMAESYQNLHFVDFKPFIITFDFFVDFHDFKQDIIENREDLNVIEPFNIFSYLRVNTLKQINHKG